MLSIPKQPVRPPVPSFAILRALSRLTAVQLVSGIGLLFLALALAATVVFIGRQWQDERLAKTELSGLPAAAAMMKLAKVTAEHRDMSAGLLAGAQEFGEIRAAKQAEVERTLLAALDEVRAWTTPEIVQARNGVNAEWSALSRAVAAQTVPASESFQRHNTLIQHQLELLDEIVSVSTLALDGEPVVHYLTVAALQQQPLLGEMLGQLRGVGTGILAQPVFAPGDASLIATMLANRSRMFDAGMIHVQRTGAADPSVLVALEPQVRNARATFERATRLIKAETLRTGGDHMAASAYFATVTKALDAQSELADATFKILNAHLQSRADAAGRAVLIALTIGAVLLGLTSCMIWLIIRTVRSDIRWREAALRAADESSTFLSAVLEAAPDAVVILDAEGTIELVNSRVEQTFGYSRSELVSKPGRLLFSNAALPDSVSSSTTGTASSGSSNVVAADCRRSDHSEVPVELSMSPVVCGGVSHRIVIARDVSERRAMQRELQTTLERKVEERTARLVEANEQIAHEFAARAKMELELRQAQRLEVVGRLAAGIAHEINTPVQFISDSLEFIRDGVGDLVQLGERLIELVPRAGSEMTADDRASAIAAAASDLPELRQRLPRAIARALDGVERVSTIVRSMRFHAHPDSQEMAMTDLNEAISSTLTIARSEYKYIAELVTDFGSLPMVTCFVGDLNQVVVNLVVNAAHAISDVVGTSGKLGRITVKTWCEGPDAFVSIGDTGGGIPEYVRDYIFEPFFTTKEVGKGTGQGLAIARGVIVEKHGGSLTFETKIGEGTTFLIQIPIDGVARPQESAETTPSVASDYLPPPSLHDSNLELNERESRHDPP